MSAKGLSHGDCNNKGNWGIGVVQHCRTLKTDIIIPFSLFFIFYLWQKKKVDKHFVTNHVFLLLIVCYYLEDPFLEHVVKFSSLWKWDGIIFRETRINSTLLTFCIDGTNSTWCKIFQSSYHQGNELLTIRIFNFLFYLIYFQVIRFSQMQVFSSQKARSNENHFGVIIVFKRESTAGSETW